MKEGRGEREMSHCCCWLLYTRHTERRTSCRCCYKATRESIETWRDREGRQSEEGDMI